MASSRKEKLLTTEQIGRALNASWMSDEYSFEDEENCKVIETVPIEKEAVGSSHMSTDEQLLSDFNDGNVTIISPSINAAGLENRSQALNQTESNCVEEASSINHHVEEALSNRHNSKELSTINFDAGEALSNSNIQDIGKMLVYHPYHQHS